MAHRDESDIVYHNLYVKVVTGNDSDNKSRDITLQVLKYVHSKLEIFTKMGLSVKVNKIRSQDLQNPKLINVMRQRGITRLPALTTSNNIYIGFAEITDIYERNIKEFLAFARRSERSVEGIAPEDDLTEFYKDEMTISRAEHDTEESAIGESEDMMDA